jgi:hypothetical protein
MKAIGRRAIRARWLAAAIGSTEIMSQFVAAPSKLRLGAVS